MSSTSTIEVGADVVTLINTFTVRPEQQQELVDNLVRATEDVIRHRPGFVAANIHASLDGQHVANYAQWRSVEDFRAMLADPACQEHLKTASELAQYQPILYQVKSVHHS
jgi:quinol monooxygenase YgiN